MKGMLRVVISILSNIL